MNGRVIKFEGSVHAEADRLLPWYVNDTLDEDERRQVEQHLVECLHCQQEVAWLRNVQEEFAAQAEQDDVAPKMQHLHRRMGTRHRASPTSSVWQRRERRLAWLVALQAAVILGLGLGLLSQQHVPYRTLSAPGDKGALLVVVFNAQAREAQMRELVRESGARIVGGPTAQGAYVLRVPDAREASARKMLAASPQVTLVEDLSSGGNP
jgi:anti-sigma factor RsiW